MHREMEETESEADSSLENLNRLINTAADLIEYSEDKSECPGILRTILKIMERICYENVENLVTQIRDVASKVEVMGVKVKLTTQMRDVASKVEEVIFADLNFDMSEELNAMMLEWISLYDKFNYDTNEEINAMNAIMLEAMDIYDKICDIRVLQPGKPSDGGPSRPNRAIIPEEIVVGFEDEAMTMKNLLTGGKKQLEVVSIVGMPGLGKTTLARKVYNDPYISYHFHIRAWTYVSQLYRKKELLLEILNSLVNVTDEIQEMSDEKLGDMLYKRLKDKRYLIVMDDLWSIGAWDDIRVYVPNDNNGSKVLFTSRLTEVALHAKPDGLQNYEVLHQMISHSLRFLTEEESWELLYEKVFQKENCPPELLEIGKQIARKCEGLPLAIVVIAGLLAKNEKTEDWWKHVSESVSSFIGGDPNQYMNTLALSYDHLPIHLKPCFLYLGAFWDDREIPVWKLILLWVAEGFIQQVGQKRLEELAEDYLLQLIDRNLVIVATKRSNGGIKACHMHDLLRDLCLKKAEEFNFLEWRHECKHASSSSSRNGANNHRRSCINSDSAYLDGISQVEPSATVVRSLLCFGDSDRTPLIFNPTFMDASVFHSVQSCARDVYSNRDKKEEREKCSPQGACHRCVNEYDFLRTSEPSLWLSLYVEYARARHAYYSTNRSDHSPRPLHYRTFKFLKVLDLWRANVLLSSTILELVHLRYLAIQTDGLYVLPQSISNLSNLETLILGTRSSQVIVPHTIQKMVKLRHLYSKGGQYHINFHRDVDGHAFILENLQTISYLCPSGPVQDFLASTPNLRKLGFRGHLISSSGHFEFPDLHFLNHLETLKLYNQAPAQSSYLQQVRFPTSLKSLILRETRINWEEMRIIGMLPNLEILKLETNACQGPQWETTDGDFHRLKFLKFKNLAVER